MSPPVADTPRPQECWGLYDASGKLWTGPGGNVGVFTDEKIAKEQAYWLRKSGWSIRPVVVTVKEDDRGG